MLSTDPSAFNWRKSSFSEVGNCVEVTIRDESVLIRDSKYGNDGRINDRFSSAMKEEAGNGA